MLAEADMSVKSNRCDWQVAVDSWNNHNIYIYICLTTLGFHPGGCPKLAAMVVCGLLLGTAIAVAVGSWKRA